MDDVIAPSASFDDDEDAQMQQFSKESAEVSKGRDDCFFSVVKAPAMGGYGVAYFEATVRLFAAPLSGFPPFHFFVLTFSFFATCRHRPSSLERQIPLRTFSFVR